jgi:predicted RNA binding protein YcfA (HicA-like mRNA interferase family)
MITILEMDGWFLQAIRDDLAPGTLASIFKQASITKGRR